MGKIFYMMGKSASGKDTLFKEVKSRFPELSQVVLYSTRPIRSGETDGVEYHFVDDATLDAFEKDGKVIELRCYQTMHGPWKYATVDDGQIQIENQSYFMIGTLESYKKMKEYFGTDIMVPLYIEVEDGERLSRALSRERTQAKPKYEELCRRFLADQKDFSEENLKDAGVSKRFFNINMNECIEEIVKEIQNGKF